MKELPKYETFYLHELKDALNKLNENENPEEADIIKKYISEGGYKNTNEQSELENIKEIGAGLVVFKIAVIAFMFYYAYSKYLANNTNMALIFLMIGITFTVSLVMRVYLSRKASERVI